MPLTPIQRETRKWIRIARIIAATTRNRMRFAKGDIGSFGGSTHSNKEIAESIDYSHTVFGAYLYYGGLRPEDIAGKSILELGPGDNVGVALLFLAHGARRVTCMDKYYSIHDVERERRIYVELRRHLTPEQRRHFDEAVQLEPVLEANAERIEYLYGSGAQEADAALSGQHFDIILSRAVIEEVTDTDGAFRAMDQLLTPGALLLHKIDLSDYGTFSSAGMHPLEFLTIPHFIYRWMSDDNGRPNRRTLAYYRDKMKSLGYRADLFVTEVFEGGGYRAVEGRKTRLEKGVDYHDGHIALVGQVRRRLAAGFRQLPDEELLAAGIFLVARKPERPTPA